MVAGGQAAAVAALQAMETAEGKKRSQLLQDALNDRTIDPITQKEIEALYNSGGNSDQIASLITSAQEGKGIYAVRKINYAREQIAKDQPGRMQLAAITPGGTPGGTPGLVTQQVAQTRREARTEQVTGLQVAPTGLVVGR